jgi:hypothetical protein
MNKSAVNLPLLVLGILILLYTFGNFIQFPQDISFNISTLVISIIIIIYGFKIPSRIPAERKKFIILFFKIFITIATTFLLYLTPNLYIIWIAIYYLTFRKEINKFILKNFKK